MKKSILNLGKVLSRSEQQQLLAGDTIKFKPPVVCVEGMCNNMPNPDHIIFGPIDPLAQPGQFGPVFVDGVCRDGQCYYS